MQALHSVFCVLLWDKNVIFLSFVKFLTNAKFQIDLFAVQQDNWEQLLWVVETLMINDKNPYND